MRFERIKSSHIDAIQNDYYQNVILLYKYKTLTKITYSTNLRVQLHNMAINRPAIPGTSRNIFIT